MTLEQLTFRLTRASRRQPIKTFFLAGFLLVQSVVAATANPGGSAAEPKGNACAPAGIDTPLANEPASSGIMFNLAEHPKSIRAVAGRLLDEALVQQQGLEAGLACADCKGPGRARVVYKVAPMHFLPDREQKAVCLKLDGQTRKRPFEFAPRRFGSVTELNDWIMGFSQGRGPEGEELYRRCSANCSPRYEFVIAREKEGLNLETRVQCGPARDRSSDEYAISTALRVDCGLQRRAVAEARN